MQELSALSALHLAICVKLPVGRPEGKMLK